MERFALVVGDKTAKEIMEIAHRKDWPGERKMEEILRLDPRFAGKNSNEWAALLGITSAAVRGYDAWKAIQQARKTDD
jgi:hypothetical protein